MTGGVSPNTDDPPRLPVAVGLSTSPQSEAESKGRERKEEGAFQEQEVCDDLDESPIFTQPDHHLDTVPKVYQPNPIDPKDYPGTKSIWQRPVTVPARCPASKGQCPSMPASSGLFNGHNIPSPYNPYNEGQVEIWEGGNLIHIVKQRMFKRTVEGEKDGKTPKRGKITGFSRSSQRRMRIFMATLKLDGEELPQFVTLTYPDVFPEKAEKVKEDLYALYKRLKRRWPDVGIVWRLEFKVRKSGVNEGMLAPHLHLLIWGVPDKFDFKSENNYWCQVKPLGDGRWRRIVRYWNGDKTTRDKLDDELKGQDSFKSWLSRNWYSLAKTGDLRHYKAGTNVRRTTNAQHVMAYVSKYMSKEEQGHPGMKNPGRFWGALNQKNIPKAEKKVHRITGVQAQKLIRIVRGFIKSKTKRNRKVRTNQWSTYCICRASKWSRVLSYI